MYYVLHFSVFGSPNSLSPLPAKGPRKSPVSPIIATNPKLLDLKSFVCHTYEERKGSLRGSILELLARPR